MGSKRGASGTQRKQTGDGGTADKDAEKDIAHRRTIAGSRFGHSRQSLASNLTSKTKDDSPLKKEQPSSSA